MELIEANRGKETSNKFGSVRKLRLLAFLKRR